MDFQTMEIRELTLPDAFLVTPKGFPDSRGVFFESFRHDLLEKVLGHPFTVAQSNFSVSHRRTLRGIHGVRGECSQAKLVTCVRGAVLDIVVDLRVGSPAFGRYEMVWLDHRSPASLYIGEGMGHSLLALEDDTAMHYYCSKPYIADAVYTVDPLDKALALPWGLTEEPVMSENDRKALSLAEAVAENLLPTYAECLMLHDRIPA
jgi:NDP-hexose 3,5-(Or5-) epimerase